MTEHTETRKLAAVMFTDIEGYSAMLQKDETSTIDRIENHRRQLETITVKHHGRIIQFYGDGSLVIFDSVMEAIQSAVEIQIASNKSSIPVRIGIHLGDIIIKEGNIFGDAVNVASRIQTVGIPGSIVVSKKIADELRNHSEIETHRIGKYNFKNIKEAQEVFAIMGHGLSIPQYQKSLTQKKSVVINLLLGLIALLAIVYFFKYSKEEKLTAEQQEEKIAIPPFENFTGKDEFNLVSMMAAHWITTELIELVDANVVSYPTTLFNTNTSEASMALKPAFTKKTGATNIIKGTFYLTGKNHDSLVFSAIIVNLQTNKTLPVPLDKVYCRADDPLTGIKALSNEIKGFWKSKNDNVLSTPNYEAYIAYLQARNNWEGLNDSIPESYLRKAIQLDPNFLDAYFLLTSLFINRGNPEEVSDTLKAVRERFTNLTGRQENYLLFVEEYIRGRRTNAFQHLIEEYKIDPKELFTNTTGMVLSIDCLNDPESALSFHQEIEFDSLDLRNCYYCRERAIKAMEAYRLKGDATQAGKMGEHLKPFVAHRDDFMRLIEYYMWVDDTSNVNRLLSKAAAANLKNDYRYLYFVAGRQAALKGNIPLRNHYADMAIALYAGDTSRSLARVYYLKDDFKKAEEIYHLILPESEHDSRVFGELGMIYARKGNKDQAESMIKKVEERKRKFDYGEVEYLQARIYAHLGNKAEAIRLLNKSIDEGMFFVNSVSFDGDPDLMMLRNEQGYKDLLVKNRYKWN